MSNHEITVSMLKLLEYPLKKRVASSPESVSFGMENVVRLVRKRTDQHPLNQPAGELPDILRLLLDRLDRKSGSDGIGSQPDKKKP